MKTFELVILINLSLILYRSLLQQREGTTVFHPPSFIKELAEGAEKSSIHTNSPLRERLKPFSKSPSSFKEAIEWIVAARKEGSISINHSNDTRATMIQIGANDGQMYDPFYGIYQNRTRDWHSDWMGLLVEPQPELYSQVAVYHAAGAPDWEFYHGALASPLLCQNGTIEFCETKTPGEGNWTTQGQINTVTSSFCTGKTHIMQLKKRPCVTSFAELLQHASPTFRMHTWNESNGSYNIDFLQIDVEGADYGILQRIDWNILKPMCIQYEQHHLGKEKSAAIEFVKSQGYTVTNLGMDVLACQVL